MPAVARKGDTISHGGYIVDGAHTVFTNGIETARKTDPVLCDIHGPTTIAEGSPNVFAEGLEVARIGDHTACGATIITGSPNVFANGA